MLHKRLIKQFFNIFFKDIFDSDIRYPVQYMGQIFAKIYIQSIPAYQIKLTYEMWQDMIVGDQVEAGQVGAQQQQSVQLLTVQPNLNRLH